MAVEIFKLFGSIFVNNDEANKSIAETEKKGKGVAATLGNGIKTAGKWGAAMVGGAAAGVGALSSVAENTENTAPKWVNSTQLLSQTNLQRQMQNRLTLTCMP